MPGATERPLQIRTEPASIVPERPTPFNGLLIVDKPGHPSDSPLPTSHDIVARVRRWSGQRRIGHTGTLDPMASGVLALCLGRATRLVEYYQGHDKQYLAHIALGVATDTYAYFVKLVIPVEGTHFSDNYFDLFPGQERLIEVWNEAGRRLEPNDITVSCLWQRGK